jgi:hypothetical protein
MENDNLTDLFEVLKSQGVFQTQEQMMSVIESDGLESLYGVMPKGMFNDVQEFSTTFNPVKKKEETMVDSGQPATDTPVLESKSVSPSIDATRFQPPSDGSTLESQPLSVEDYLTQDAPAYTPPSVKDEFNANERLANAPKVEQTFDEMKSSSERVYKENKAIQAEQKQKREKEIIDIYVPEIAKKNNISEDKVRENLSDWALSSLASDPNGERIDELDLNGIEGGNVEMLDVRNKLADKRLSELGEQKKQEAIKKLTEYKGGDSELAQEEFKKEMDEVSMKFLSPEEKKAKQYRDDINIILSNPELSQEEKDFAKKKLEAFDKLTSSGVYSGNQLYDPRTGNFVSGNTKDKEILEFNAEINKNAIKYENTDLGTLKKRRDDLYFQFQQYVNEVMVKQPLEVGGITREVFVNRAGLSDPNNAQGIGVRFPDDFKRQVALESYNKTFNGYKDLFLGNLGGEGDDSEAFKLLNSGLWGDNATSKANQLLADYMAVNKMIALNKDPGGVDDSGFFGSVGQGLKESLGGTSTSEAVIADRQIEQLKNLGYEITPEQKDKLEKSMTQKVGYAVGSSIPASIEIGLEIALLNKVSGVLKIPELAIAISKGNKAAQFASTLVMETGVNAAAFSLAGEGAASGTGEGVGQVLGSALMNKFKVANKILNVGARAISGASVETLAEYSGQYLGELSDNGFDWQKASEETFGKTADDAIEKLAITFFTGLTMGMGGAAQESNLFSEETKKRILESDSNSPIVKEAQKQIKLEQETTEPVEEKTVTLSEPQPTSKAMAKTLKISNGQTSDINVSGEKVGEITTETVGDKVHIRYIDVKGSNQKKGYAKKAYQDAAIEAEKQGKVLASDKLQTNDQAKGVWESLVRDGDAKKNEDGTYEMVKEQPVISSENSSNYANMTEDEDGNFVFFHVGNEGYETIEPRTGGDATSKEEAAALSKIGGAAMYYTDNKDSERESGSGAKYAVKVPKDKVYDFNSDELGLIEEARTRHEEEHPVKAFDKNTQMAYITKIAGEKGFDMVVGEWNGRTRAQTTKALAPTDTRVDGKQQFQEEFQSNKDKGFESVIPQTRDEKLNEVYDEINDVKNKAGVYDNMYSLKEDALLRNKTQEQITEEVQASDLSQELKDKYMEALNSEVENRRSVSATENLAKNYKERLTKIKEENPEDYWSVDIPSDEEIESAAKDGRLVDINGGMGIVTADGNLIGLFKYDKKAKGTAKSVQEARIKLGGIKTDNFDGYLTKLYESNGFRVVSRVPFNEEFAPEGWNEKSHGRPDIVAMVYDPNKELDIEEKTFADYDEAMAYRDSYVDKKQDGVSALVAKFKGDNKKVLAQVDNAKKAIAKVSPDTKIIVHNNTDEYIKSGEERTQGEAGAYDLTTDTIHINLENANERTVAHEVFHAILLNKGMSNKQAQSITDRMLEAVKKTASPELIAKIELFSSQYENSLQSEESIAELFGILASEYETLPKPTQSLIKRWLDALAKLFGLKTFTDSDIIGMLNTVSGKVQEGVEITEGDVSVLNGEVSGTINSSKERKQTVLNDFELKRFPVNLKTTVEEGVSLSRFNGKKSNLLESDRMTGAYIPDAEGNPIFKFFGGLYFPVITGKWWASRTISKANGIAKNMNSNRDSDGYIYATPIVMKPKSHMSNQDMFDTVWEFMKYDLRSPSSKLTKSQFHEYVSKALSLKSVNLKESDLNINKSDSIEVMINKMDGLLIGDSKTLSFEKRRNIIQGILGDQVVGSKRKFPTAGSISEVAKKFEEEKTSKATKLWDVVMVMRTKGNLTAKVTEKSDEFYHKSYPSEISSDSEIEVFFLDGAYGIDSTYPKLTKSSGGEFSWNEYVDRHPSQNMALSQYGRTAKLSKASGNINSTQTRKQNPNRPSIEDVRAEAIKLGLSEADLKLALLQLGYTDAEINSTKEQTMADAIDKFKMSQKRGNKKSASVKSAIADMQSTNWYRLASDTSREEAVRELKKELGVKIKKAPSVKKVSGKKADKVTVNEMTALKSQIRLEAKAAKGAVKAYKDASKSLVTYIKQMSRNGVITSSQAMAIIKKVLSTNMLNEKLVNNLIKYADGIFENAELSQKISKARKLNKNAKRNLKSKVGASRDLQGILSNLFSIDPSLIPLDMFDMYFDLVSDFGQRKSVLTLKESSQVIKDASDIINNIEEGIAKEEREKLPKEINEEIEADLDAYFGDILSTKIDKSNLDSDEAIELANFLNSLTKEDLESMVRKDKNGFNDYSMLENLKLVKDNLTNGYTPSMASSLRVSVKGSRSATEMTDVIKNKSKNINIALLFNRTYGVLKSAFTGKRSMTESVRSTMTTAIDDVLGNFNSKTIYNATFGRLAKAYAAFEADLATNVTVKLDAADFLLNKTRIPTVKRLVNEVQKSKYKIQAYRLQREYESNPESNQVSPAIEFIDATINAIKDNKEGNNLNERDIAILESVKNDFESGGDISMKKIEDSFSDNEKKALKLIDEASDMEAKALWTSTVIRGDGMKPINNYVHHNVSTDSEVASVLKKSGRMTNPSTKSGTFRERTKGAKPINFDPISSTATGARETLIDYHMTEAVKTVNSAVKKVRDSIDDVKAQREAVNAIENVLKETLESVLNNQFTELTFGDKAIQKIKKLGYQAALASIPRAGAELGSNMMYAFTKPTEFLSGVKNFSGFSMGSEGMNAMKNLGSSETMRLYDTNAMTSKMVDAGMSYTGAPESQKSMNAVAEKVKYISQFTGAGQVRTLATSVADKLISTPDNAISRPMWFGTFSNEFKKETGKSLTSEDMYKISDGTSEYLNENYKEARDKATIVADRELIKMASSKNPFNIIPKNVQKPNSSAAMKIYKGANTYMASFMLNEYVTARNAVLSVFAKGDMSKAQAGAALTGITMRMSSYMILYSITTGAFDSLFGFESEDDEDDLEDLMKRQLLGAPLSMITGRGLGNVAKIPINYGVEMFNEEFLSSLRSGEDYDPYKHSVVFSQVSDNDLAKKSPEEIAIKTFAGAFSPIISSGSRAFKVVKGATMSAKDETKAKYKKELEDVIILESLGNLGFVPFYKDIRRMVRKNNFKNFEKEKSKKKKEKKKDVFGRTKGF